MIGRERPLRADPAFGIRQITGIARRALSPGINDPTTATMCMDRLGELLDRRRLRGGRFGDRERARGAARLAVESARGAISLPAALERVVHAAAWAEPDRLAT